MGLSVGYFARKVGLDVELFERNSFVGGNAITFRHGDFLFDSGAHRFHDKDDEMTKELLALLGDEIHRVSAPSQIYYDGRYIDFPMSPLNLFSRIGIAKGVEAGLSFLKARIAGCRSLNSFEDHSVGHYGRVLSSMFLLNYSEKLWGIPTSKLSVSASGSRLKGLTFATFLKELFVGKDAKTKHLDGSFYYPKYGFGTICERFASEIGHERISLNAGIEKVFTSGNKIKAVQLSDGQLVDTPLVVSTLPLTKLVNIFSPAPDKHILETAKKLRFRNVLLLTLFFEKESISPNASIYFPQYHIPFTRAYEPRNRSALMSAKRRTSIVIEIPCQNEDALWQNDKEAVFRDLQPYLKEIGWLDKLIDYELKRMPNAYPVLEIGSAPLVYELKQYLSQFTNLHLAGRNGVFEYTHVHDMMRTAYDLIRTMQALGLDADSEANQLKVA
jgi:protoporphyrinogen oxidase